MSVTINYYGYN